MNQFPIDIARLISDYTATWVVAQWLRDIEDTLPYGHNDKLTSQQRAREKRRYLCANPLGEYELGSPRNNLDPDYLSQNPADWALDILETEPKYCSQAFLSINPNPRAIALIDDVDRMINDIGEYPAGLMINPNAIDILRKRSPNAFNNPKILANPNDQIPKLARFQLRELTASRLYWLSMNPAPWAIDILKKHYTTDLTWFYLTWNPDPWACECVINDIDRITVGKRYNLRWINRNPGMVDYLREHPEHVNINIWANPAIFEPTPRPGVLNLLAELAW